MTSMRLRGLLMVGIVTAGLAGCAKPTPPPRFVTTIAPPKPPPPAMPYGGYPSLDIPGQRVDGSYVTPNFEMTDAAAVWHLRGALNVAALACDQAGGGVLDGYNIWIKAHQAALEDYNRIYLKEWEDTTWWDWREAYEANMTRLYNFYSQSTLRVAFCAAARDEIVKAGAVADSDLPRYARAALARLDKPFIDFYTAFDAWRDYYAPKAPPPKFLATVPVEPAEPPAPPSASPVVPTVVEEKATSPSPAAPK